MLLYSGGSEEDLTYFSFQKLFYFINIHTSGVESTVIEISLTLLAFDIL